MLSFLVSRNNQVKSLLSRMSAINDRLNIWVTGLLQNDCKSKNIVRLIIDNHDPSVFIHLIDIFIFLLIFRVVWEISLRFAIINLELLIIKFYVVSIRYCLASEYHITVTFFIFKFTFLIIILIKHYIFLLLVVKLYTQNEFRCQLSYVIISEVFNQPHYIRFFII